VKKGDLIYDSGLGLRGIIIEVIPDDIHTYRDNLTRETRQIPCEKYRIMYEPISSKDEIFIDKTIDLDLEVIS